ncbi:MAG: histidine kinase [Halioglobus sp.]
MQPSQGNRSAVSDQRSSGEFFIPNLCAPRQVFVMVLLSELMVLVYALAVSDLPRFNWDVLALSSLFVQWVVLLSAAFLCLLREAFSRQSLLAASAGSLLIVIVVTIVSSLAARTFFPGYTTLTQSHWWLARNVMIALVLSGVVLRYFYLQQQITLKERAELQARLDALRNRIRPHFLFNTMNSIASLIESRPAAAEQAVEDLSELFRASLQEAEIDATVSDEVRLCELYLGIEQLRLGERLSVEWQVAEDVRDAPMPSLILQPLVENAIYHGIAQIPAGGTVRIKISASEGNICVRVQNPLPAATPPSSGHHMAVTNIEQRLTGLYESSASLEVERAQDKYSVTMSYPAQGEL